MIDRFQFICRSPRQSLYRERATNGSFCSFAGSGKEARLCRACYLVQNALIAFRHHSFSCCWPVHVYRNTAHPCRGGRKDIPLAFIFYESQKIGLSFYFELQLIPLAAFPFLRRTATQIFYRCHKGLPSRAAPTT